MGDDLQATWRALEQARDLVADIRSDLTSDHASLAVSVHGLLARWHGPAAGSYRQGWDPWSTEADDVLETLETMGELIGAALTRFERTDDDVRAGMSEVQSRLSGAG